MQTYEPWILEYRNETDRNCRRQLLMDEKGNSNGKEEWEIRWTLWEMRYGSKDGRDVDYFIRGLINLQAMKRRIWLPGEKKRQLSLLGDVLSDWQFAYCLSKGHAGERALYDELFNMTLLYLDLCRRDKMFNSVLLGLGHIQEDQRVSKIEKDIFEVSDELPCKLGCKERLCPFPAAARDAFFFSFPYQKTVRL